MGFFPRVSLTAASARLSGAALGLGGGAAGRRGQRPPSGPVRCQQHQLHGGRPETQLATQVRAVPGSAQLVLLRGVARGARLGLRVPALAESTRAPRAQKAARLTAEAEALQAAVDGKIAYFNWVRARGSASCRGRGRGAGEGPSKTPGSLQRGLASKADVLRIEAQLAAAQQSRAEIAGVRSPSRRSSSASTLGVPPDKTLEIGSDVMNEAASAPTGGRSRRCSSRPSALQAGDLSLAGRDDLLVERGRVADQEAGYSPRIDAFADDAMPNELQPAAALAGQASTVTWDVGTRLSWTLNDTFTSRHRPPRAEARLNSVDRAEELRCATASVWRRPRLRGRH